MKALVVLLVMNFMMTSSVSSQNSEMVLTNKRTHHHRTLNQGKIIKVLTISGKKVKGKLNILNDSTISIGKDTLFLSNINKLRAKTLLSKITGGAITTGGAGFIVLGSLLIAETHSAGGFGTFFGIVLGLPTISAGILLSVTGVTILAIGKNYRRTKWDYSIRLKPV